jgi:hypothetical protein
LRGVLQNPEYRKSLFGKGGFRGILRGYSKSLPNPIEKRVEKYHLQNMAEIHVIKYLWDH